VWYLQEMRFAKVSVMAAVLALSMPAFAKGPRVATATTRPAQAPAPARAPAPAAAPVRAPAPAPASPADEIIVQYQRVGHEIVLLQRLRGNDSVKDLWQTLHHIDLDKDLATADGRVNATLTLAELHDVVERRRGVEITKACQDNPVAAGCQ
jgi:hypothetical protein